MPRDRILTETDGLFAQLDGRAALPWDAEQAIVSLAELWGESVPKVRAQISINLRHLAEAR
jgi:TatD DNase family protein